MTKIIFILILSTTINAFSKVPDVKFILNDDYMILHALTKSKGHGLYQETIVNLQSKAKQIDSLTYEKLFDWRDSGPTKVQDPVFQTEFSKFFSIIKSTNEFRVLKMQTFDYLKNSKKEWNHNLRKATKFMEQYSGFKFGPDINLYITHPASNNGRTWSTEPKVISFGTWPEFDNYFTVYVWHEILHTYMSFDDVSHSVIQMLTDVDLQNYLNPQSNAKYSGHPCLKNFMDKNQKEWELYKQSPTDLNLFSTYLTKLNNVQGRLCNW